MECKHEFIGTALGVHCKRCGLQMTAEEYRKHINTKPKPKRAPRKKVKTDE